MYAGLIIVYHSYFTISVSLIFMDPDKRGERILVHAIIFENEAPPPPPIKFNYDRSLTGTKIYSLTGAKFI